MGRAGTRYWISFLGTLFLGLILAAASPGSLLSDKAMDLAGWVMKFPEWPARALRNAVMRTIERKTD